MRRFLVNLQFCGKNYNGFQKNGEQKTIQGELENAIFKLFNQNIDITGVSRTDAGVSAYEYYFHFDADTKLPADRVAFKLNRFLPADIQCQQSVEVPFSFDARKNCVAKTYEYLLYKSEHLKPLLNKFSVKVSPSINVESMKKAANYLIGKHDFSAFMTSSSSKSSRIKTVNFINIFTREDNLVIAINADGFLYNMVRIIVGTLISAGVGEIPPEKIKTILESKNRENAGLTMPPKGLTLKKVFYDLDLSVFGIK